MFCYRRRNRSEMKSLTRRSRSSGSNEDNDDFREVVYPAYSNYSYYGYGPEVYLEAPAEMFAGNIPKRHDTRPSSSRHSNPLNNEGNVYDNFGRGDRDDRGSRSATHS